MTRRLVEVRAFRRAAVRPATRSSSASSPTPRRTSAASAPRGRAQRRPGRRRSASAAKRIARAEIPLGARGRTLTLVGLGKSAGFTAEKARAFVDRAIDSARSAEAASLGLVVPEHAVFLGEAAAERIARRLALAEYRFDPYPAAQARRAPQVGDGRRAGGLAPRLRRGRRARRARSPTGSP